MPRHLALTAIVLGSLLAAPALAKGLTKPLKFAPGASTGEASGAVIRGERDRYEVGARKGQTMQVIVSAKEYNAAFQIYQPGWTLDGTGQASGKALKGAGETDDAASWSGKLPANGTYLVVVGATRGNATYRLSVGIK